MDDFGTKEKTLELDMGSAGIRGQEFNGPDVNHETISNDNMSHDTTLNEPQPPPKHESDAADPYARINRERDELGLPHVSSRETILAPKESNPWDHLGMTLGLPMVLLFDIVVPCIIYYVWYNRNEAEWERQCIEEFPGRPLFSCPNELPQFDKDILGSAVACFGIGELWIWLARVYRLWFDHKDCAPLLSRHRFVLDATSWVYLLSMGIALIPFTVGSSLVKPKLYLYGPSLLMGFLGLIMLITTLCPFTIPIPINSQQKGSKLRPFMYYAAEDFIAVDGLQDREFRVKFNDRYETNPMFRRFLFNLTLWWALGVCTFIGCVSAVIWTLDFHFAFGTSLGVLFSYIAIWASVSYIWTGIEMEREHEAYERGDFEV